MTFRRLIIVMFALHSLISAEGQTFEFFGPLKSWSNLKIKYHARGDGKSDDTQALQSALDDLDARTNPVLYIPPGIYNISKTLILRSKTSIRIIGDDPTNTIIKWKGSSGGNMLHIDGVSYSQYSRLTLDGSGIAAAAALVEFDIQRTKKFANTGSEFSDMIFKDASFGILTGGMHPSGKYGQDSECSIFRCRFYRCSISGISLNDWNDLQWFVWTSWFEDCAIGVTNDALDGGAGNFQLYQNKFLRSRDVDVKIGMATFYSLRYNTSFRSKRFLQVSRGWNKNSCVVTIQGNKIVNTTDPIAIDIISKGNILFLDNQINNTKHGGKPAISYKSDAGKNLPDLISVGNNTVQNKLFDAVARSQNMRDTLNAKIRIDSSDFQPVAFLKRSSRKIVEVFPSFSVKRIQDSVDELTRGRDEFPVVHFNPGNYSFDQPLTIKEGSIQLVGDGATSSSITWTGIGKGPMIVVSKKARMYMANLYLRGAGKVDILDIAVNDQAGSNLYLEQVMSNSSTEAGINVEGLTNSRVDLVSFYHYSNKKSSLRVAGIGPGGKSWVEVTGTTGSNNFPSFEFTNGAHALVLDSWYEGITSTHYSSVSGASQVTFNGSSVAVNKPVANEKTFALNGFSGSLSVSQAFLRMPSITFDKSESGQGQIMFLGCVNQWDDSNFISTNYKSKTLSLVNCRYYKNGSEPKVNKGDSSSANIISMLDNLRKHNIFIKSSKSLPTIGLYRVQLAEGRKNCTIHK